MKTICNTYVVMESQEQCDRMKQLCIDNNLPIWDSNIAFDFYKDISNFCFSNRNLSGKIGDFALYPNLFGKNKVTEKQFIKLLKNTKL